jgi:hypothetical protein
MTQVSVHVGAVDGKTHAGEFQNYAAALRAQGCPDKTVRELVASRITAAFQTRRTAIRKQSRQDNTPGAAIQAELDALNREQGALIERLFGAEEPAAAMTNAEATPATAVPNGIERAPLMPAVMAEALPATVSTAEQAADWEKVRYDFVNAIGGPNQDPADPQYRKRWTSAESEADRRFRLLFGDTAFVQHQLKAQQEALLRKQGVAGN